MRILDTTTAQPTSSAPIGAPVAGSPAFSVQANDPRPWFYDANLDDNFWFVSDNPASDSWVVKMTCAITGRVKTEAPSKTFVGLADLPRRNAWQITPFSHFGYATIEIIPADGDPFVVVTAKPAF